MKKILLKQSFTFLSLVILHLIQSCNSDSISKLTPLINWSNPSDITSDIALSTTQLNATADVPGIFKYTPESGSILSIGSNQSLKVEFIPTDEVKYKRASKEVFINIAKGAISTAVFNNTLTYNTVADNNGLVYKTISIGTQTWMAENLRTTKYRNGEAIVEVTDNTAWKNLVSSAQCTYTNTTDLDKIKTYGRLYNWYAVNDSRNIAPIGWHVATQEDWNTLTTFLAGESVAGGKLKEVSTTHWNAPNTGAINSSGFTALPSGRREYVDGSFINQGYNGFWWTNSTYNPDYSWYRQMNYDGGFVNPANFHKQYGFAVRCVKD